MVCQSYAIWPHMSVFDNVAYGLRVRRLARQTIEDKVREALELVQMGIFASRRASQLSGGRQQRGALARAFVFSPAVLLFDEPLSNLDAKLRAEMRIELRELQHRLGITSVYVTHDLEEALAVSDRIVVPRDGRLEQVGTPVEIYNLPRNPFVADFVGSANLLPGRHRPDLRQDGLLALESPGGHLIYGMAYGRPIGTEGVFSVRTVHLHLSPAPPGRLSQRLAGHGPPFGLPGGFHPVPGRLGGSATHHPSRGRGARGGRDHGLPQRRSPPLRAAGDAHPLSATGHRWTGAFARSLHAPNTRPLGTPEGPRVRSDRLAYFPALAPPSFPFAAFLGLLQHAIVIPPSRIQSGLAPHCAPPSRNPPQSHHQGTKTPRDQRITRWIPVLDKETFKLIKRPSRWPVSLRYVKICAL
jgi:energy-coupling factor transporter ATP-binding protein EcfA2